MSDSHPPPATMMDIARTLGISQSAVSLALRGSTRIAEATRARVHQVAKELGYQPNPLGTGLSHFRRHSKVQPVRAALGWINLWDKPERLHSYKDFQTYWQGAFNAAEKCGYRLDEISVKDEIDARRLEQILLARNIRGLLIPPTPVASPFEWRDFDWNQFSIVRFGRTPTSAPPFNLVTSAQSTNAATALLKISETGYERIGLISYNTSAWTYVGGFLQAQMKNLPEDRRLAPFLIEESVTDAILFNWKLVQPTLNSFNRWWNKWRPDAVLTEIGAVAHLLSLAGKRVPQDVGVAGLNILDLPFDAGINQNPEEIGRAAVLQLIVQLTNNDHGIPVVRQQILVEGSWRDGKSLPPAKRKSRGRH